MSANQQEPSSSPRRFALVRADDQDPRPWLQQAPICSHLAEYHIAHVEILEAIEPLNLSRPNQSGTCLLACLVGSGYVHADGGWKRVEPNQACLLPPFVTNKMRSSGNGIWRVCAIRYREPRTSTPIISSSSPVLGPFDPAPLRAAIEGLHAECIGANSPDHLHHWTELIHSNVLRFARPHNPDKRLWTLWNEVEKNLEHPWTLDELAQKAFVCREHLRRLCMRALGRSPMQHVTFLRIQRARELLSTTDLKVDTVTRAVGYKNPNTFSNTFQKWTGWRPSEYRDDRNSPKTEP